MNNDIYATPKSEIIEKPTEASRILLYSPTQVALGTIGGPVGLIYFLMSNFESLNKNREKKITLLIGIIFIFALVVAIPFLPENFPSMSLTIAYIVVARLVAEKYQITKKGIINSELYDFHSNWRVFSFGLLCLLGSVAVLIVPLVLLIATGIWAPT